MHRDSVDPSYEKALEVLFARCADGMKLGLEQINRLLDLIGHPERQFPSIHIAGTNGKGSTAALIESILRCAGYRTGLYTSPHLVDVRERILISGHPVTRNEFIRRLNNLKPHYKRANGSFFEILTAMAFSIFAERSVDAAVLETGLGGRLDATNTVVPAVTVITEIGLEHTRILGKHLEEIANEKAGILKTGIPCVCGVTSSKVLNFFKTACAEKDVPVRFSKESLSYSNIVLSERGARFDCDTGRHQYRRLFLGLLGKHQVRNAGLALMAVETLRENGWSVSEEAVREGFATIQWPARLQLIPGRPRMLLDSAHNPMGIKTLAEALNTFLNYRRFIMVFGVLKDKDYRTMLARIKPVVDHVIFTRPMNHRALDPSRLPGLKIIQDIPSEVIPDIESAWEHALSMAEPDDLVGAAGSMYLVGEIMKGLQGSMP